MNTDDLFNADHIIINIIMFNQIMFPGSCSSQPSHEILPFVAFYDGLRNTEGHIAGRKKDP